MPRFAIDVCNDALDVEATFNDVEAETVERAQWRVLFDLLAIGSDWRVTGSDKEPE
jgi:hypothetical protein